MYILRVDARVEKIRRASNKVMRRKSYMKVAYNSNRFRNVRWRKLCNILWSSLPFKHGNLSVYTCIHVCRLFWVGVYDYRWAAGREECLCGRAFIIVNEAEITEAATFANCRW